jgi:uncharacterized protein
MKCPVCEVHLVMMERLQVEIDYCPKCRGVWLDRGELDKLIERSTADQNSMDLGRTSVQEHRERYGERDQHIRLGQSRHHDPRDYDHKKHKRRSILEELFGD